MNQHSSSRRQFLGGITAASVSPLAGASQGSGGGKQRRVGAIGNGMRGREVLRALRAGAFPGEIVALCDIVRAHAEEAVAESGGNPVIYDDYRKLLAHEGLDTVFISTPNFLHKEMVLAALDRKLDVFCEKPMALNTAECDEMIKAWRSSSSVFIVGLQNRYHRLHVKVHELINAGVIGDVKHIAAAEFRNDWKKIEPGSTSISKLNWRYHDSLSGGIIVEKNCHDFDLFNLWTSSFPSRVCGAGSAGFYSGRQGPDHASVVTEYDNGCTVSLDVNVGGRFGKGFHDWVVAGTRGQMVFRRKGDQIRLTTWEPAKKEEVLDIKFDERDTKHGGTLELLADFFQCLKTRDLPSANPLVGRQSVKAAQAAQLAIRSRRMVEVAELGL